MYYLMMFVELIGVKMYIVYFSCEEVLKEVIVVW